MTDYGALLKAYRQQLAKAARHLQYSYNKVVNVSADPIIADEETLETWESFVARFGRATDIFCARYLRAFVLQSDAGFRGSLRDQLNLAEKLGLIADAEFWMGLRELRNRIVHEYDERKLKDLFEAVRRETPQVLALLNQVATE